MHLRAFVFAFLLLITASCDKIKILNLNDFSNNENEMNELLELDGKATVTHGSSWDYQNRFAEFDAVFLAASTYSYSMDNEIASKLVTYVKNGGALLSTGHSHLSFVDSRSILQEVIPVRMMDAVDSYICAIAGLGFGSEEKIPVFVKTINNQHEITKNMDKLGSSTPLSLTLSEYYEGEALAAFYNDNAQPCNPVLPQSSSYTSAQRSALVVNTVGKGRVAFFGFPLGCIYTYVGSIRSWCYDLYFSQLFKNTLFWITRPCHNTTSDNTCVNGVCSEKNLCSCNSGYTGATCDTPFCSTCDSRYGTCTSPEVCTCKSSDLDPSTGCTSCKSDQDTFNNGVCTASPGKNVEIDDSNKWVSTDPQCTATYSSNTLTLSSNGNTCTFTYHDSTGPIPLIIEFSYPPSFGFYQLTSIPSGSGSHKLKLNSQVFDINAQYTYLGDMNSLHGNYTVSFILSGAATLKLNTKPLKPVSCEKNCQNSGLCKPSSTETPACECAANSGYSGAYCTDTTCGDGILAGTEECDDSNTNNGDGCDSNCKLECGVSWDKTHNRVYSQCGDGVKAFDEQCDDGNTENNDGCSSICKTETNVGFECSQMTIDSHNCVRSVCSPICGDGKIIGSEECDFGSISVVGCINCKVARGYVCTNVSCSHECGDGVLYDIGDEEQCDDGNKKDGDGCSHDCKIEEYFTCDTKDWSVKSLCYPKCGDGHRVGSEQCDDGNDIAGDGCSSDCQIERGFVCEEGSKNWTCHPSSACSVDFNYTIIQPTCNDNSSRSFGELIVDATAIPSDGVLHFSLYNDKNELFSESNAGVFKNLLPGVAYTLLVENRGYPSFCNKTEKLKTISNLPPSVQATVIGTDVTGCASTDGTISVNISSGLSPFKLVMGSIDNPIQFDSSSFTQKDVSPAFYRIQIIDANDCTFSIGSVRIGYPESCLTDQLANMWSRGGTKAVIIIAIAFAALIVIVILLGIFKRIRINHLRKKHLKSIANVPDSTLKARYNIKGRKQNTDTL